MFDEPEDDFEDPEHSAEKASDPKQRAKERCDEFRMHAELAAVFEGVRKFDASILTNLPADLAREIQQRMAKLEKAKVAESPLVSADAMPQAEELLNFPLAKKLSTNDYHIRRRPGEVMMVRFLAGAEVDSYYKRLQAHFDAALNAYRQEERQAREWKQDPETLAYLDALDALEVKMEERYLRPVIRQHKVFVLSTQTADELDILHLCDYIMGVDAAEVVGRASAPGEQPTEQDRAWFFKLFSLRGIVDEVEKMCLFAFLQKTQESW